MKLWGADLDYEFQDDFIGFYHRNTTEPHCQSGWIILLLIPISNKPDADLFLDVVIHRVSTDNLINP